MEYIVLPKIEFGVPTLDAAIDEYRRAIMNANRWSVSGNCVWMGSPATGYTLHVDSNKSMSATVTTAITAAPSASKLGKGEARLRVRERDNLTDGDLVTVYSNMLVLIPVGTRIEVAPDGEAWKLVASNCVTP